MTQDEALQILKNGHNVFLTGAAGSGKTYLLNQFIQFLKAKRINVGVTASTGIAATHMQGITIHSWTGIGIKSQASDKDILDLVGTKYLARRLQKSQVLVIDEVSMLDADRIDLVEKVVRLARQSFEPFGGLQVVLCGDFFQLPPVARADEPPPNPVYKSAAWRNMNLKICYLHEQHRQGDHELLNILNAIRAAKVDEAVVERLRQYRNTTFASGFGSRFVRLYSHNPDVDWENQRELGKISGPSLEFKMSESGVPAIAQSLKLGCLAPEKLTVKKGAAVMFVKNNFEKGFVNGSLGTVSGFNEDGNPVVMLHNGNEIVAEPASWSVEENGSTLAQIKQIPIRLAWAITVHKSQGMTLDAAQVDLSRSFVRGMGYVALSRVRSLAGLRLLGFNALALKVDEEILNFDQELKDLSEQACHELKTAPQIVRELHPAEAYSVEEVETKTESSFKRWTPEEDGILLEGARSGLDVSQLAEKLGRKNSRVQARLKKLAADALKRQVSEQSEELW
jgi:ATP-dependent exoDNAse (exonuclease V) alpha subunit